MNIKGILKNILPPFVVGVAKKIIIKDEDSDLAAFLASAKKPWSKGYGEYKEEILSGILQNKEILEVFRKRSELPANYGYGLDERIIEYPWFFSNLPHDFQYILDAGSVLNQGYILANPVFKGRKMHILTLAPEAVCFWKKGISYVYEDMRSIPVKDNFYDFIACLSTLEHIGCDNVAFTKMDKYKESNLDDFEVAMQEMRRVLKPDGVLFLSVPYGQYQNLGAMQQFNRILLTRAINAFGVTKEIKEVFYKYTDKGWQISSDQECADCQYVEWLGKAYQANEMPTFIPLEPDYAAAARAVACVKLVKQCSYAKSHQNTL